MHLSDAAKAVYLITVVTGKQEDGSVYCEDNGTRLNVYQVDTIESNSFRFAASCYLFGDTKYKLHWRHLESGDKCGYSLGEKNKCARVFRSFTLVTCQNIKLLIMQNDLF